MFMGVRFGPPFFVPVRARTLFPLIYKVLTDRFLLSLFPGGDFMGRFRVKSKRHSARKFNRSSRRTKGANLRAMPMRGGIRL